MINKWQTFFLIVLTLPIMGHVVLLPLTIELVGRDSWLAALITLPVGILFVFVLYQLRKKYQPGPIHQALPATFGKFVSTCTLLILLVYFIFLAALSIAVLVDLINSVYLPATPRAVLVISFLLLSMYGATKSLKGIALTAGILFLIVMFSGHSVTFLNFREREVSELLPILENGWKPVWFGVLLLSNVWLELLFLLVIPISIKKEKYILIVWIAGILLNVIMMLSTMSGSIMTFGLGQTKSFVYPALEIVRIIDIDFIDRLDVYALILMTLGSYIRGSLFLKLSYQQIKQLFHFQLKWVRIVGFLLVGVLIGIISYWFGKTRSHLDTTLVVYAYMFVLYPLPFLLLLIAFVRKRKGLQHSSSSE